MGGNPDVLHVTSWFYNPRVYGAIILLAVSALVAWMLGKK
jgi:tetrahydromethanopterin S-methyltransferase subunit B